MSRQHQHFNFLFGPVPSRRLGVSLGVDLMPHKTCSLDCVFCECGRTTHLTIKRDAYTPVHAIKQELDGFLRDQPKLDHITFSGSGEPLLHGSIRELVSFIKLNYPHYRLALLTNGTLLYDPQTGEDIAEVDIVKISINTVSKKTFKKLNRPHPDLDLSRVMKGILEFSKYFRNKIWVETFLVPGLNDTESEVRSLKKFLQKIHPDHVHINTLDRPGTEPWVGAVDKERIRQITEILEGNDLEAPANIQSCNIGDRDLHQDLLTTLKRRPCTAEDISKILGTHFLETKKYLEVMNRQGEIDKQEMPRGVFYLIKQ